MKKYSKLAVLVAVLLQSGAILPTLAFNGENEQYRADRDVGRADRQQMKADTYAEEGRRGKAHRAELRARHDQRMAARHAANAAYHRYY